MKLKSDKEFEDAVKGSSLKKERKEIIAAQLKATSTNKLDELFRIWGGNEDDGGLAKAELAFAKSLVEGEPAPAETKTVATPGSVTP